MPIGKTEENTVVLLMDRGDEDVKLITSLLNKTGFHVVQSSNEKEVLDLLRSAEGSVQLVIVDTDTPGIHMSELLDQVQAVDPSVRMLLISDQKDAEPTRQWSVRGNVRGHLSRPFRRARFLGSVLDAAKAPLVRTA